MSDSIPESAPQKEVEVTQIGEAQIQAETKSGAADVILTPKIENPPPLYFLVVIPAAGDHELHCHQSLEELKPIIDSIIKSNGHTLEKTKFLIFYGSQLKITNPISVISIYQDLIVDGNPVLQMVSQFSDPVVFEQ